MTKNTEQNNFGGLVIEKVLFDFIRNHLPDESTILELGSGWATGQLAQYYTMYSIEENMQWLNQYNTTYIYAPLKDGWYDKDVLAEKLPHISYDCILIDGPKYVQYRWGFYDHIALFDTTSMMIFDEVHLDNIHQLFVTVAEYVGRSYTVYKGQKKHFGVIWPAE